MLYGQVTCAACGLSFQPRRAVNEEACPACEAAAAQAEVRRLREELEEARGALREALGAMESEHGTVCDICPCLLQRAIDAVRRALASAGKGER